MLSFGGSTEAAANCLLMSIGKLGLEENKKHSKVLSAHLEKTLGVSPNRYNFQINTPSFVFHFDLK